jgi:hypothetical protein
VDDPDTIDLFNSINDVFFVGVIPGIHSEISDDHAFAGPDDVHSTNIAARFAYCCGNLPEHPDCIYYFKSERYAAARTWRGPHTTIIQAKGCQ